MATYQWFVGGLSQREMVFVVKNPLQINEFTRAMPGFAEIWLERFSYIRSFIYSTNNLKSSHNKILKLIIEETALHNAIKIYDTTELGLSKKYIISIHMWSVMVTDSLIGFEMLECQRVDTGRIDNNSHLPKIYFSN